MSKLKISPELLQISPEVQEALKNKKPVVALESTIIWRRDESGFK